ncbi:HD domain-containing protein [Brevibacillus fluminis]|uniref:5'-deoxynucleotidase n=1 Tax=Brevibacillus fluminis TaxID=511487 RepID=A0A3M8D475_9BACL|nr:HD domain-containing protein [Brevibacillus fluminis]RNB82391.1 HD domain-containing protein [Brevibacillus fluminis]
MKPTESEKQHILSFVKELERLKDQQRTAWTGMARRESIAEHSWRLTMFALILEDYFPDVDCDKVLRMCLIHDLGECYDGDVSATIPVDKAEKERKEEAAITTLSQPLASRTRQKLLALWHEYNAAETKEAKLAKALDKMETILQHNQGKNPSDFNYVFNLDYGRSAAQFDPLLASLRELIDQETMARARENGQV